MKNLSFSFPLFALLILSFSCGNSTPQDHNTNAAGTIAKDLNVAAFEKMMTEKQGIILDVRTQDEYNEGHIDNCVLIDWYSASFNKEVEKLDKTKPIYVYCHVGGRSSSAMKRL